jgi:hypothetical protein
VSVVAVGDVYVNPRGRRYRVLRFVPGKGSSGLLSDVVLLDESSKKEDLASATMVAVYWRRVES